MTDNDRRKFSRIDFDASVDLEQDGKHHQAHLLDISLKGIMLELPDSHTLNLNQNDPLSATISLNDDTQIRMEVIFSHNHGDNHLGFRCFSIDIESISHLRRLVELNLGDPEEAERELHELIHF